MINYLVIIFITLYGIHGADVEEIHTELQKPISELIQDSKRDPSILGYLGTTERIEVRGNIFHDSTAEGIAFFETPIAHLDFFFKNRFYSLSLEFKGHRDERANKDNQIVYLCGIRCYCHEAKNSVVSIRLHGDKADWLAIRFNRKGELNLFDSAQQIESDRFPLLYIDTSSDGTFELQLDFGQGKGIPQSSHLNKGVTPAHNALSFVTSRSTESNILEYRNTNRFMGETFITQWYKARFVDYVRNE